MADRERGFVQIGPDLIRGYREFRVAMVVGLLVVGLACAGGLAWDKKQQVDLTGALATVVTTQQAQARLCLRHELALEALVRFHGTKGDRDLATELSATSGGCDLLVAPQLPVDDGSASAATPLPAITPNPAVVKPCPTTGGFVVCGLTSAAGARLFHRQRMALPPWARLAPIAPLPIATSTPAPRLNLVSGRLEPPQP